MMAEPLVMTEENVEAVLADCEETLGTLFGSNAQSLSVGITGHVELAELNGPFVIVRLSGRFWHARSTVLERVQSFIVERIPECAGVDVEDPSMLDDSEPTYQGPM